MKLTKLLAMLLALCMILCCFAACDFSDKDDDDEDEKVEEKEKDKDEDEDEDEDDKKSDKDDEDDDKKKPSKKDDDIEGEWLLELSFGEMMEESMGIKNFARDLDCDATLKLYFEFDGDEMSLTMKERDIEKAYEEFLEDFYDYLGDDDGLEAFANAQGFDMDEFEDLLDGEGLTKDDYREQLIEELENQSMSHLAMNESQGFEFDGEIIEMESGAELEVELDGDEMEIIDVKSADGDNGMFEMFVGNTMERQ